MESILNQFKQHLYQHIFLTEAEWTTIRGIITKTSLKKGKQLFAKNGEFFFLASGLLIENQNMGSKDLIMVRFFQKDEVFIFPREIRDSEIIAVNDCILLGLSSTDLDKIKNRFPDFFRLLQTIKEEQPDKYFKRQQLLQGLKNSRFDSFCKSFPGLAPAFSLTTLAGYLDVNPSYLSSTKKLRKRKPDSSP